MKYHDYHLRGYSIRDHGRTIILDLVESLTPDADVSVIRFSEVIAHQFIHLGGAVITEIFETTFLDAARETDFDLSATQTKLGGLPFAFGENSEYQRYFIENRFKTWLLISAIGFQGLIVGKDARQEA